MEIKLDITPSVRGEVIDDPEFQVGLKMSLPLARLLHAILNLKEIRGYMPDHKCAIDSCLSQAIELAEARAAKKGRHLSGN